MRGLGSAPKSLASRPPCPVLGAAGHGTRPERCRHHRNRSPAALPWQQEAVTPRQGGGWRGELHAPGHVWGSRRKIHVNCRYKAIACWLMHSRGGAVTHHQAVRAHRPCRAGQVVAVCRPPQLPGQRAWCRGHHLPAAPQAQPAPATGASQLVLACPGLSCGVLYRPPPSTHVP